MATRLHLTGYHRARLHALQRFGLPLRLGGRGMMDG